MTRTNDPPVSPRDTGTMPRRRKVLIGAAIGAAAVLAMVGSGVGALAFVKTTMLLASASERSQMADPSLILPDGRAFPGQTERPRYQHGQDSGSGQSQNSAATASTADEKVGVVTVLTTVDYNAQSRAAGTGMVMTAGGLILTNNHVIADSTNIAVTVESTGKTYDATLVGTDATNDVAVLQLINSSGDDVTGLDPVTFDTNGATAVGDEVHSVGNASGTGDLVTAAGSVTAIDESITVGNEYTGASESLNGLIQLASDVVSGDSGGPLFDNQGEVIGIVTAASSGRSTITGFAIDIDAALRVVRQIDSGVETGTVQIGYPAFLGIQLSGAAGSAAGVPTGVPTGVPAGVPVAGVFADKSAAAAGIVAGDTITAIDDAAVTSAAQLTEIVSAHSAGDQVVMSWIDASGTSQSATVTLGEGPA